MKVEDVGSNLGLAWTGKLTYVHILNGRQYGEQSVKHYASSIDSGDKVHLIVPDEADDGEGAYLYFFEDEVELLKATLNFIKMYKGQS